MFLSLRNVYNIEGVMISTTKIVKRKAVYRSVSLELSKICKKARFTFVYLNSHV